MSTWFGDFTSRKTVPSECLGVICALLERPCRGWRFERAAPEYTLQGFICSRRGWLGSVGEDKQESVSIR
jgi:hypothetical protein